MSWLWGSSKKGDDEDDASYEYYSDDEYTSDEYAENEEYDDDTDDHPQDDSEYTTDGDDTEVEVNDSMIDKDQPIQYVQPNTLSQEDSPEGSSSDKDSSENVMCEVQPSHDSETESTQDEVNQTTVEVNEEIVEQPPQDNMDESNNATTIEPEEEEQQEPSESISDDTDDNSIVDTTDQDEDPADDEAMSQDLVEEEEQLVVQEQQSTSTDVDASEKPGDVEVNEDDSNNDDTSAQEDDPTDNIPEPEKPQGKHEENPEDDEDGLGEEEEEEEEETTLAEKQSLLLLAAEHDRVDILKSILSDDTSSEDRAELMCPSCNIPPLHVAISFGSVNATQSLLRMGADPSIRPNVSQIRQTQEELKASHVGEESEVVQVSNMGRFDNVSAWELGFGRGNYPKQPAGRWSLFSSPSKQPKPAEDETPATDDPRPPITPIDMAPAKREGIKHAFTAEALRCVGADELHRLKQLLDSGMPPTIDIGGRALTGWANELGATDCKIYLNPEQNVNQHVPDEEAASTNEKKESEADATQVSSQPQESDTDASASTSAEEKSVRRLANRCDELESLAEALSVCLDNLAEEVSVCQSLLLQGGGTALASHVKSLKSTKDNKLEELSDMAEEFEDNESDLAAFVEEAEETGLDPTTMFPEDWSPKLGQKPSTRLNSLIAQISRLEEYKQREKLNEYITASERKVRKLRSSIADLSEESAKALEEVERRGLIGGINLVRSIREEIRDIEFQLSETKTWNIECQAKIDVIRMRLEADEIENYPLETLSKDVEKEDATDFVVVEKHFPPPSTNEPKSAIADRAPARDDSMNSNSSSHSSSSHDHATQRSVPGRIINPADSQSSADPEEDNSPLSAQAKPSEQIASGESTAIVVRNLDGYLTSALWQVILRIIGLKKDPIQITKPKAMQTPPSLMIV